MSFKHYGNLPAPSESIKFRAYVYDFLVIASQRYLATDFEELSNSSLILDEKIRQYVQSAEKLINEEHYDQCVIQLALARYLIFKKVHLFVPRSGSKFRDLKHFFQLTPESKNYNKNVFNELDKWTNQLELFNSAILAGGKINEHLIFASLLSNVVETQSGSLHVVNTLSARPTKELAEKAIKYVIDTVLNLESLLDIKFTQLSTVERLRANLL